MDEQEASQNKLGSTRLPPRSSPWGLTTAAGGAAWVIWALAVRPEWTAVLLLMSPFVLLPLGLRLASWTDTGPEAPVLRLLARLAPVFALSAAVSFFSEVGLLAAILSVPWLAFTAVVALVGLGRLLSRQTLLDPGIGADAGLLFVAVGGVWFTISRAGLNPLGFSDAIVQLTAVHFHYAGFALPIVAGFAASRLGRSVLVPAAVVVGVPLTAIGITAGGWIEWVAATAMALAGMACAWQILQLARTSSGADLLLGTEQVPSVLASWLMGTAGVALMGGMGLGLGWSWSIWFGWDYLGLESMAAIHGSLNALGFGLLGLVGLNMLSPGGHGRFGHSHEGQMSMHLGRPSLVSLGALAEAVADRPTTNPIGLLNRPTPPEFNRKCWQRNVDDGDFAATSDAIRQWRGHKNAGIRRYPVCPEIQVGETLALAIPVGPLAVTATCRIVDIIDEPDRYGFTYSTLAHHPEDGEESFIVARHGDGSVDITVTAVWRPTIVANHVLPPLTRFLQNRAINRYLDGIATDRTRPSGGGQSSDLLGKREPTEVESAAK